MAIYFHAFTDGDAVVSGLVRGFRLGDSEASFRYSYSWLGVNIEGTFNGERDDADVKGTWDESSKDKVGGRTDWSGRAKFTVHEALGRRTLIGVWGGKTGKMTERWSVDEGK